MNIQDLIDIAEEAIRNGEKVCNGANIHDMRAAITLVQMNINHVKRGEEFRQELLDAHGFDIIEELLKSIERLRKETLKHS